MAFPCETVMSHLGNYRRYILCIKTSVKWRCQKCDYLDLDVSFPIMMLV